MITREETINMLDELNKKLYKMTDEELYDYMMENSQSFRIQLGKLRIRLKKSTEPSEN